MSDLVHRIRVFVYRFVERHPHYLLLRGTQGIESFWTPIHGPIGFGEKLETAIRREVMDDIGLGRPNQLIDLEMPSHWVLGDEEIVEWNFGFQTQANEYLLHLDPRWSEFRWSAFTEAYPSLELENDRAAIVRLHTLLHAA
ncbi:MAG: NUDIX domain-containing protein [Planctomycetota bacterium]|nr:NUDIX domain-containing protein [Planctomycetota bacterium]